jgi:hypothetical protein
MKLKMSMLASSALFFFLMAGGAILSNLGQGLDLLWHFLATVGVALALYYPLQKWSSAKKNVWNALSTALILFLVLHYGPNPIDHIYAAVITALAIFWKFFGGSKGSPWVNPAAAAILAVWGLAHFVPVLDLPNISWWGASFKGWVSLALVGLWIVFGLRPWKKYWALGAFLVAHFVFLVLFGESKDFIQYVFSDSTLYFFASVMLIEPKTSPFIPKKQVLYGVLAALLYTELFILKVPQFALWTLVVMNGVNLAMTLKLKPSAPSR